MKKILLSVFALVILISTGVLGISVFAEENETLSIAKSTTAQSTYTTAERTDDDPFAEGEGDVSVEKETPTFYYILVGVAGVIIIFSIVGLITSKNKK